MSELRTSICQAVGNLDAAKLLVLGSQYSKEQLDEDFHAYFTDNERTYFGLLTNKVREKREQEGVETLEALVHIYGNEHIDLSHWKHSPPVINAIMECHVKLVKKFVELGGQRILGTTHPKSGYDPGSFGLKYLSCYRDTVFHEACFQCSTCMTVNIVPMLERPAIFFAVNPTVIKLLIQLGGKGVNHIDSHGNNILFYSKSVDIIKLVVRCGAEVDVINRVGITAFSSQCSLTFRRTPFIDTLLALNYTQENKKLYESKFGFCIDEDQVAEIRYDVYFSLSLVGRLLEQIELSTKIEN